MMSGPLPLLPSLLAALGLALSSVSIHAEEEDTRWYQVEVIVFSQADNSKTDETWRPSTTTDELPFAAELLYPVEIPTESTESKTTPSNIKLRYVEATLPDQYILQREAERIAETPDYHLLVHKGWVQSVERNTESTPVVVNDLLVDPELLKEKPEGAPVWELPPVTGEDQSSQLPDEVTPSPDAEEQLRQALAAEELDEGIIIEEEEQHDPVLDSIPVVHEGPEEELVFGTIGLKWSRYLHLVIDMTYRRDPQRDLGRIREENLENLPVFSEAEQEQPAQTETQQIENSENGMMPEVVDFRIQDSRRLRRNKLYYFDHPLFGVLVKVTSYEPPKADEESPSANPSSALGAG